MEATFSGYEVEKTQCVFLYVGHSPDSVSVCAPHHLLLPESLSHINRVVVHVCFSGSRSTGVVMITQGLRIRVIVLNE